jgi:hypothetical protein
LGCAEVVGGCAVIDHDEAQGGRDRVGCAWVEGGWAAIGHDGAQGGRDAVGCVEVDSGRTAFDCTAIEDGNDAVGWGGGGALGCPLLEMAIAELAEGDVSDVEVEQGWSLK